MDFHIIPECYIDTNLVETLVPPTKFSYNHQKGCNNVTKKMKEDKLLKDGFALGIVDQDKKILEYTKEFEIIAEKAQLVLLKHPKKHHYLIYITPAIEKWILYNADEVDLNLADFDLPHDFLALQKHTKLVTSNKDDKFKKLFKALRNQKAEGFLVLSKWITHLKSNPYDADLDFLKED
jgi:hypothetical protein